ncbi:uncharacterized protein MONBRDRAFT_32573 [Monosiga brevicollis MX1]|uniref:TBC1 domain family member 31 n=1 Tax=Monosiga brevicollis TaxID=81824 RepID=A9V0E2_MONBE|nr:uncharacterized protein MONBRDRAFT_32573 [Monosiga brevicollis MX1]EDQ89140.1 predicted protein [Monosiga brevicollis MX1]|eukprot:XP_001746245.1 hypothetical protein [Monosiga brevicollis MX1]
MAAALSLMAATATRGVAARGVRAAMARGVEARVQMLRHPLGKGPAGCRRWAAQSAATPTTTSDNGKEAAATEPQPNWADRIVQSMGWLGGFYTKKQVQMRNAKELYSICAERSLHPHFYRVCDLPDTFQSWYLITQLHLYFFLVWLKQAGGDGPFVYKQMVTLFWEDVDHRMRIMGVDDRTIQQESLRELFSMFYGLIFAYDEGVAGDDMTLAAALWRNMFHDARADVDGQKLAVMVEYVRREMLRLDQTDVAKLIESGEHESTHSNQEHSIEPSTFFVVCETSPDSRLKTDLVNGTLSCKLLPHTHTHPSIHSNLSPHLSNNSYTTSSINNSRRSNDVNNNNNNSVLLSHTHRTHTHTHTHTHIHTHTHTHTIWYGFSNGRIDVAHEAEATPTTPPRSHSRSSVSSLASEASQPGSPSRRWRWLNFMRPDQSPLHMGGADTRSPHSTYKTLRSLQLDGPISCILPLPLTEAVWIGGHGGFLKVFDARTLECTADLTMHEDHIASLQVDDMNPDWVWTASRDAHVVLWNAQQQYALQNVILQTLLDDSALVADMVPMDDLLWLAVGTHVIGLTKRDARVIDAILPQFQKNRTSTSGHLSDGRIVRADSLSSSRSFLTRRRAENVAGDIVHAALEIGIQSVRLASSTTTPTVSSIPIPGLRSAEGLSASPASTLGRSPRPNPFGATTVPGRLDSTAGSAAESAASSNVSSDAEDDGMPHLPIPSVPLTALGQIFAAAADDGVSSNRFKRPRRHPILALPVDLICAGLDGELWCCSPKSSAMQVFDTRRSRRLLTWLVKCQGLTCVKRHDDVVWAGGTSGAIYAWHARTKHPLLRLCLHTDGVVGLAISPDARHLATASAPLDGSIIVHNMAELMRRYKHDTVISARLTSGDFEEFPRVHEGQHVQHVAAAQAETVGAYAVQPQLQADYDQYGFMRFAVVADVPPRSETRPLESRAIRAFRVDAEKVTANDLERHDEYASCLDPTDFGIASYLVFGSTGVLMEFWCHVWKHFVAARTAGIRRINGNNFYKKLVEHKSTKQLEYAELIKVNLSVVLDLLRTFSNNVFFQDFNAPSVVALQRVLTAFAFFIPRIGYTQGFNRLVAFAMLYLNEEWAFYALDAIVEKIMRFEYYNFPMTGCAVDRSMFVAMVKETMPELHDHFQHYCLDLQRICFSWFFTAFVNTLPTEVVLRIWDAFLCEGRSVLFRYGLALLKLHKDDILQFREDTELNAFFKEDLFRVRNTAFHDLGLDVEAFIATNSDYFRRVCEEEEQRLSGHG